MLACPDGVSQAPQQAGGRVAIQLERVTPAHSRPGEYPIGDRLDTHAGRITAPVRAGPALGLEETNPGRRLDQPQIVGVVIELPQTREGALVEREGDVLP